MKNSFYNSLEGILNIARDFYNRGDFESSKIKFEDCIKLSPNEPLVLFEYGCCLFHSLDYENSLQILKKLIAIEPEHARGHALIATIYSDQGLKEKSCFYHYQAIRKDPILTQSAYGFAKSSSCSLDSEEYKYIESLQTNRNQNINHRIRIYFALSELHYLNKDYAGQIKYLKKGNELAQNCFPFNSEVQKKNNLSITSGFSKIEKYSFSQNNSNQKYIFILGLPRSGSTLLEQMLAGHSLIKGAGETESLSRTVAFIDHQLKNTAKLPSDVSHIKPEIWQQAGKFLDQQYSTINSKIIVDKQLFNFSLAGFAKMIKPQSLFIDLRRNPASQFISCYSILFGENRGFTHSVESFIDAYNNQRKLIEFWKQQFPENFITVYYEDLIRRPELTLNSILEKIDCSFEESCLKFYLSKSTVSSASQLQVREPLYTSSLERWKNYQQFLKPESVLLQPLIDNYIVEME